MRKPKAKKPSPENPVEMAGSSSKRAQTLGARDPRPQGKVGVPDPSWSDAKWLALADQALSG
jgi:hypothetical protein